MRGPWCRVRWSDPDRPLRRCWLVGVVGEFPRGLLAGGSVEAFCDREVGGCRGDFGEGFAVEGVDYGGEVEVVLPAAASDVDVGLGACGGGVDSAGGHVAGRALNGVRGERVCVVDT